MAKRQSTKTRGSAKSRKKAPPKQKAESLESQIAKIRVQVETLVKRRTVRLADAQGEILEKIPQIIEGLSGQIEQIGKVEAKSKEPRRLANEVQALKQAFEGMKSSFEEVVSKPSPPEAAENKTLVRRFYEEVFNKKNLDALDKFCVPDFLDHNPDPNSLQGPGLEGVKQMFSVFLSAFPDMKATVEDLVAEGDKVVSRIRIHATHTGEFMGMAPTGKQVTISGIDILRIEGGKAVERWGNFDELGMMRQLGAIPAEK